MSWSNLCDNRSLVEHTMQRALAARTRIANWCSRLCPLSFVTAIAWFAVTGCGGEDALTSPALHQAPTSTLAPYHPPADGTDWPAFLGPTGDGKSSQTGILLDWPANGPPVRWHVELGSGYGGAAVSDGRLFIFDRTGDEARLRCLDSVTGSQQWQFTYPSDYRDLYGYDNGPRCCPVVDGDRVYLFDAAGILHCVRASDGERLWRTDTMQQFGVVQNFFGVSSAPVVEGDLLIVQIGGSPPESKQAPPRQLDRVSGNGSGIVAFHKRTGKVHYQITDELASYTSPCLATIDGRRWCFVLARGGLVGFEPASGRVDFQLPWRAKPLESVNASSPVVVGDEVFISEAYGPGSALLRIRPGGYDFVWRDDPRRRQKAMQTHWNTAIHYAGYLYGSSGRYANNALLKCIDWKTGQEQWSVPGLARCSLLYVEGHFICLSETGALLLFRANAKKFDLLSQVVPSEIDSSGNQRPLLKQPAWAAPVLAQGLLYVRGADRLICLDLTRPPQAQ